MVNTRSKRVSITTVLSAVFFAGGHDSLVGISAFAPAPAALMALMRVSSVPTSRGTQHQTLSMTRKDDGLTDEERQVKMDKALKSMTAFSNKYIKKTDTKYCTDMSVPAVVIKGLAEHKVALGAPLCPCRFYDDKEKEVKEGYWNCPCVPMRETKTCHCMLFLTEDNAFAGDQTVSRSTPIDEHDFSFAHSFLSHPLITMSLALSCDFVHSYISLTDAVGNHCGRGN